jgi:hypothetical protein
MSMSSYIPNRSSDPVKPDGWQTGQAEFNDLTAKITGRGWAIEHDANMTFYGAYWILTPFGEFSGQGFGRGDSLQIAFLKAVSCEGRK